MFKYILWSHLGLNSGRRCDLCLVGQAIQSTPRFHPPTGLAWEIVTVLIFLECTVCLYRIVYLHPLNHLGCIGVNSIAAKERFKGVAHYTVSCHFGVLPGNKLGKL
jgi:hypothetical protein